jgi:hypothetical protein
MIRVVIQGLRIIEVKYFHRLHNHAGIVEEFHEGIHLERYNSNPRIE